MKKLRTFSQGGVLVREFKEPTEKKPIERIPLPARLVVPLSQHFGAPCEPVVKRGETVRRGQKIGLSKIALSADIHAPAAGKVKEIGPHPHPGGFYVESVVIEVDPDGESEPDAGPIDPKDRDAVLARIREMGVVGLGGATFPTAVKLNPPAAKPIDTLILNGAECEPFLTSDHRLMLEQGERIVEGYRIIRTILGDPRVIVAVEDNKPDAAARMEELTEDDSFAEVCVLKTRYPQGAERQLISAVLRRTVPSGGLPMDVGVVVQNVGTAAAVADAVNRGRPLVERVVTVSGDAIREPKNLLVPIGTPYRDLVEFCGGLTRDFSRLVMGGPMMGKAQPSLEVPVIKGTSGVLFFTPKTARPVPELQCIRCGACVRVCPQGLVPADLATYAEKEELDRIREVVDCVECGSCNFICPSHRRLVQWIRFGKSELRRTRKKDG